MYILSSSDEMDPKIQGKLTNNHFVLLSAFGQNLSCAMLSTMKEYYHLN